MSRKPRKDWLRRPCGATHSEGTLKPEEGLTRPSPFSWWRPHFSAHFHAPWLPRAAAAISGGVVPLRESFAHNSLAAGRGLRAAFGHIARGAGHRDRSHCRDFARADVSTARASRVALALSRLCAGAYDPAAHRASSPQAREAHPGPSARLDARSVAHVRFVERRIL